MNAELAKILNLTPSSPGAEITKQQILDAVAAQTKKLSDIEAAQNQAAADELEIAKKTAVGLTREQAIAVIRRQREYDSSGEKAVAETFSNIKSR